MANNYVVMNAYHEVTKQLTLAERPPPLVIGGYFFIMITLRESWEKLVI